MWLEDIAVFNEKVYFEKIVFQEVFDIGRILISR